MVDYNNKITLDGITTTEITGAEKIQLESDRASFAAKSGERKLKIIKQIRLEKLIETDYLSNSDVTMPNNIKTFRQSLRDIPTNHTDEDAYDLLLVRDAEGKLTHSIWSKP